MQKSRRREASPLPSYPALSPTTPLTRATRKGLAAGRPRAEAVLFRAAGIDDLIAPRKSGHVATSVALQWEAEMSHQTLVSHYAERSARFHESAKTEVAARHEHQLQEYMEKLLQSGASAAPTPRETAAQAWRRVRPPLRMWAAELHNPQPLRNEAPSASARERLQADLFDRRRFTFQKKARAQLDAMAPPPLRRSAANTGSNRTHLPQRCGVKMSLTPHPLPHSSLCRPHLPRRCGVIISPPPQPQSCPLTPFLPPSFEGTISIRGAERRAHARC